MELRDFKDLKDFKDFKDFKDLKDLRELGGIRGLSGFRDLRGFRGRRADQKPRRRILMGIISGVRSASSGRTRARWPPPPAPSIFHARAVGR